MAPVEAVGNYDRACGMALAFHLRIYAYPHFAIRHVAHHLAEDGGADWALNPLFVADHIEEAVLVVDVGAGQGIDVFIGVMQELLLDVPDLELAQTNGALLLFHLALGQLELEGGEEFDV